MDPHTLATQIVGGVGGPANIRSVGQCTTRLRMVLANRSLADREAIRALPGVMSTVERGGQFQVVIGHEVAAVAAQVRRAVSEATGGQELAETPAPMSALDRVFDLLAGTFQPLLWPLVGAGLVRTLLALAVRFGWVEQGSGTWTVWAAAGSGFFVLLPVFVGITAAAKLGANRYVGGAIGAALVSGTLLQLGEPGTRSTFLGLPMRVVDYGSTVFPAILAAVGLALLEGWLRRVLPKDLHLVAVPALCLAILVPATVVLFGPIGSVVADWIATAVTELNAVSPMLTGALYAATFMFLVMFGLHWAIVPVTLAVLAERGAEPLGAYMGAYNFAAFGVALGVVIRTRDPALRQLGGSGLATGLLAGISEPTVYGILLRYRRALAIMLVAAATGGALLGLGRVQATAVAFSNLFTIPAFAPMGGYVLGIGTAFLLGMGLVVAFGYQSGAEAALAARAADPAIVGAPGAPAASARVAARDPAVAAPCVPGAPGAPAESVPGTAPATSAPSDASSAPGDPAGHPPAAPPSPLPARTPAGPPGPVAPPDPVVLTAPLRGQVVPLASLPDPVFARGLLGPGAAIRPSQGLVRAPAAGTVRSVARARHAIGLATDSGIELVIHLGLDTVHLAGRHFDVLVAEGDRVAAGQPLAHVDLVGLAAEGADATTPVVITNAAAWGPVEVLGEGEVAPGDTLLVVHVQQAAAAPPRPFPTGPAPTVPAPGPQAGRPHGPA
ncbi:MAG TPA: glucose PTS transporter subunit IIA [Candidatus Nanopelagicales bacterium]